MTAALRSFVAGFREGLVTALLWAMKIFVLLFWLPALVILLPFLVLSFVCALFGGRAANSKGK